LQHLVEGDRVEAHCGGIGPRVGVVDAVDAVLAHEQYITAELQRALSGRRVGGEERHADAGAEDDDPALLQMPLGATRDVRLGHLAHRDGGLNPGLHAALLEEVLQRQAVHHRAQHGHVVGAGRDPYRPR
jgi:hypothetical protein